MVPDLVKQIDHVSLRKYHKTDHEAVYVEIAKAKRGHLSGVHFFVHEVTILFHKFHPNINFQLSKTNNNQATD